MAYLSSGYTGAELANRLYQSTKLTGTKAAAITACYQYLNDAQLDLFYEYDWPELLIQDDYITTDDSAYYSLASALNNAAKAGFGRVRDGSVRCGTRNLIPTSKYQWDKDDPSRGYSGTPTHYCLVSRVDFRVLPYGSDGDIVYLDWVLMPVKIESDTAAADISFAPEHQELIHQGGLWRLMRDYSQKDWMVQYDLYRKMLRNAIANSSPVNYGAVLITPVSC